MISDEFLEDALAMLNEDGVPVSVTGVLTGAMTATGDRYGPPEPRTGMGLIFPARGTALIGEKETASERLIMTPISPEPLPGDKVSINGRELVVANDGVKTYAPQGLTILHDLTVGS